MAGNKKGKKTRSGEVKKHDGHGWSLSTKGYPRFHAGPMRGQYVHRYEAAKMKGRALTKDEQVHHGREGKLDFSHSNLTVMGNSEHGWVSSRQAFWMKFLDVKAEGEFYATIKQLEAEGVNTGL